MRNLLLPLLLLASASLAGINLRAGVGYSALSQKFVLFEEDTVSSSNEGKLFFEGNAGSGFGKPGLRANWMLSGGTTSFFGRAWGRWTHFFNDDFSIVSELAADLRTPYEEGAGVGYSKGRGSLRLRRKWDESAVAGFFAYEGKTYSGESAYTYDYSLTRCRLEFTNPLFGNDQLGLAWQFAFRFAPDTVEANYIRNNFYFNWDKFWGENYIRADIEAERRVNNRGVLWGNYWYANGLVSPRISAGKKLTLIPKFAFEGYRYDWANEIFSNRESFEIDGGVEWAFSPFLRGEIAPKFFISMADEAVKTDNFREISARVGWDWLKHKKIWLYAKAEAGIRIYTYDPPEIYALYSDFVFVEGSAFITWWINESLRFDVITSYAPEWHDVRGDNLTTFYLSTNLSYEFMAK